MPNLEPAYLRYIYDGLIKGSVHPENAAELPDGLIGLYEEAFDERTSVVERQKLLQRFAIWALLKKEVSAAFVAEVLGETEDEIQEFISTYSAWFNSPESGKYQLYHERLKVYLLQKLSEGEIQGLHEKLISRLEQAIEEQKADEFDWYGLEYLGTHLYVIEANFESLSRLSEICDNIEFIDRQIDFSQHYEWPKKNLHFLAISGSNKNIEHIIKSTLGLLKIHLKERSDIDSIFRFFEKDNFKLAFNRIESLIQNETKENKFVFYFQLLEELLNKKWATNNHFIKIIDYFTLQIDKIFYHNLDSLISKHFKNLNDIRDRGVNIIPLLNCFDFLEGKRINFDKFHLSEDKINSIFKSVHRDFAFEFFAYIYILKYLSFHSKSLEEFEEKVLQYSDKIENINNVKIILKDFKSLGFIQEKRLIDIEIYGLGKLFYQHLIDNDKVDYFMDFVDFANEQKIAESPHWPGARKKIYSIKPYLFFAEWFLVNYQNDKSKLFYNRGYQYLYHYIDNIQYGDSLMLEEISRILNLSKSLNNRDNIDHIIENTSRGLEKWKSWNEDFLIKEISPLLTDSAIMNSDIENWLKSIIFKDKNEFYINAVLPYWSSITQELEEKIFDFSSISLRLICLNLVSRESQEKLKYLLIKDISSQDFIRFFPFIQIATSNNYSNLVYNQLLKLASVNLFWTSYYLAYFLHENQNKITNSNLQLLLDLESDCINKIYKENGSLQLLGYLLTRLEIELTLGNNKKAFQTLQDIRNLSRIGFVKSDNQCFLHWVSELEYQFMSNKTIRWKLVKLYWELIQTKVVGWRSIFFKYSTKTKWIFSLFILTLNVFLKNRPKQNVSNSYLTNWEKLWNLQNTEKHNLEYWIENYSSALKYHLARSNYSCDDETIILLRTFYGLNALKNDNKLKRKDYEFLQLEWSLELKELVSN